jgi:ribose transport system permease protein
MNTKAKLKTFVSGQSTLIVLLLLILYGVLRVRWFVSEANLSAIFYQYSIIGLLALGQFLVILTGGIDLSQGALVALSSITTATVIADWGLLAGAAAGILMGAAVGLLNGLLVSRTNMPPFLVTLGSMGIARGLALQIANSRPVPVKNELFLQFGEIKIIGIPISAYIWVAACLAAAYVLYRRPSGMHVFAVGSSEENSRLAGIRVQRVKLAVYVASSMVTALGGIIWTARLGSGSPIGGSGYELESIAAVVVGGASLSGGTGKIGGLAAGVLVFGVINSILNLSGISPFVQGMLKGLIVIAAIAVKEIQTARND